MANATGMQKKWLQWMCATSGRFSSAFGTGDSHDRAAA